MIINSAPNDNPTKLSELTNDKGFITSYTETDPTVPSWAKSSSKPSYTAAEVGAAASSHTHSQYLSSDTGISLNTFASTISNANGTDFSSLITATGSGSYGIGNRDAVGKVRTATIILDFSSLPDNVKICYLGSINAQGGKTHGATGLGTFSTVKTYTLNNTTTVLTETSLSGLDFTYSYNIIDKIGRPLTNKDVLKIVIKTTVTKACTSSTGSLTYTAKASPSLSDMRGFKIY